MPQDTLLRFSFPDEVLILLARGKLDEALPYPLRGCQYRRRGGESNIRANVSYRRIRVPVGGEGWGICERSGKTNAEQSAYLSAFVGSRENSDKVFCKTSTIKWVGEEAFNRETNAQLRLQENEVQSVIAGAKKSGVTGLGGIALTLIPAVEDHRSALTGTLPAIAPRRIVIP